MSDNPVATLGTGSVPPAPAGAVPFPPPSAVPPGLAAPLSSAASVPPAVSPSAAASPAPAGQPSAGAEAKPPFTFTRADMYFSSGGFDRDVAAYAAYGNRFTGYRNLDSVQPLYPGLYVLGAISSLGKTTFIHQMADQLAASQQYVLYFSLEQSRFELFSKSIARQFRLTATAPGGPGLCVYPTPSSMDLRKGGGSGFPTELRAEIDKYGQSVGSRLAIIDGAFSINIEMIESITKEFIKINGLKPVVMIDYLQIIEKSGTRTTEIRADIDHVVHALKVLQTTYDLTVIVISSLNRQNYLMPMDFESFKESGGIEYTADVLWGLQLAVLSDEIFGREGKIKEKREKITEAKKTTPRLVRLVCLKNRYGVSSYTADFEYWPASDLFVPVL